jgi:hypothetical protein
VSQKSISQYSAMTACLLLGCVYVAPMLIPSEIEIVMSMLASMLVLSPVVMDCEKEGRPILPLFLHLVQSGNSDLGYCLRLGV